MSDEGSPLSESVQMYLVSILRLQQQDQPVPLSQLAATLNVSPVSANQMCRRLQDDELVVYVPYKGVSVTAAGEQLAARILRRHRLWEVFLVDRLQMGWEEAHDTACRLEHATPDEVIERLDVFLGHPQVNPQGDPIPTGVGTLIMPQARPLTEILVGQRGHILNRSADEASCGFLTAQGVRPGASFRMIGMSADSMLLEVQGRNVTLGRDLAETIQATPQGQSVETSQETPLGPNSQSQSVATMVGITKGQSRLSDLKTAQTAIITELRGGYNFRSRLAALGFTPGTELRMVQNSGHGPVIAMVRETRIALGREEAQNILVKQGEQNVDNSIQ